MSDRKDACQRLAKALERHVKRIWAAARNEALEEAAKELDKWILDTQAMRLACGELTADEVRLVKAVFIVKRDAIRSLKSEANP